MNLWRYIRTFRNWAIIFFNVYRKNFSFYVEYRDGRKVKVLGQAHLYFLSFDPKDLQYDPNSDVLSFNFNGNSVKFKGALNNGDVGSIFGELCYDIDVSGKVVLDIGANIGDSAVFYSLKGATKVIAFEPAKENFSLLLENIRLNNLSEKIIPLNKGISAMDHLIKLPLNISGTMIDVIKNQSSEGNDVELISIEKVIKEYKPQIIKIDCEGCEYEIFASLTIDSLQCIEIIHGEFHGNGFNAIDEKLQSAGFKTTYKHLKSTGLFVAFNNSMCNNLKKNS